MVIDEFVHDIIKDVLVIVKQFLIRKCLECKVEAILWCLRSLILSVFQRTQGWRAAQHAQKFPRSRWSWLPSFHFSTNTSKSLNKVIKQHVHYKPSQWPDFNDSMRSFVNVKREEVILALSGRGCITYNHSTLTFVLTTWRGKGKGRISEEG